MPKYLVGASLNIIAIVIAPVLYSVKFPIHKPASNSPRQSVAVIQILNNIAGDEAF